MHIPAERGAVARSHLAEVSDGNNAAPELQSQETDQIRESVRYRVFLVGKYVLTLRRSRSDIEFMLVFTEAAGETYVRSAGHSYRAN